MFSVGGLIHLAHAAFADEGGHVVVLEVRWAHDAPDHL